MSMQELKDLIAKIAKRFEEVKGASDARIDALETIVARGQLIGGNGTSRDGGGGIISGAAKEHADAFYGWARRGGNEDALQALEINAGLSTQSDPDGGMLIPVEIDKELQRVTTDAVAMRKLSRIVTVSGDYKRPFCQGGAGGGWVGEVETRTETDTPSLSMFAPTMAEIYALPETTQNMLDDTDFDIEDWLLEEIGITITENEGAGYITGNGVKMPKGFLDYDTVANASWVWGKLGYVAGGDATLLNDADKLIDLQHSLKASLRQNASFLMSDSTAATIRKMKDTDGDYLWKRGLSAGEPDTLLGKPVEIDDNMPSIAADTFPVAFGDFRRGYTIVDHKLGTRLLRDPFTKKGWVKFYVTKRTTGGVTNFQAIKVLKIAAT